MGVDLLLTGFGPFGEFGENPTETALKALVAGPGVVTHVFRTAVAAVEEDLPRLLAEHRPRRVVLFGLADSAPAVRLETTARNYSSEALDVDGERLPSPIAPEGPEELASTLPLELLARALEDGGVEVGYSADAGGYLCNYSFYRCQQMAPHYGIEASGFVHVPGAEAYEAASGRRIDYPAVLEAVAAALA